MDIGTSWMRFKDRIANWLTDGELLNNRLIIAGETEPRCELSAALDAVIKDAQERRIADLKDFILDFAAHDFTDATKGWPRHPDDEEPAPLTDAHTVWDMQKEARELLKGGE